ncbi:MAG: peptidoglycan-binding protein [Deltaproteobacteria bacterium]|nr:peptidoglycan-binding protein [Nannocystaceae bacterium]
MDAPEDPAAFADGGSTVGDHGLGRRLPLFVAPTTDGRSNVVAFPLVAIACWRLNHVLFGFDSSFVMPETKDELARLAPLVRGNPGAPAALFGHADPVGDIEYNKRLSGRRALAVFGILVRDADIWEELFSRPAAGDAWGTRELQSMLATVEESPGQGFYGGAIDGIHGGGTTSAIRRFQASRGLTQHGSADPATRRQLFLAYMDAICLGPDDPFVMTPEDFIGGGSDPEGKGAHQGCSEHNPVVVFSQADEQRFAGGAHKSERDGRNAPNRRVMLFLFRPGTKVSSEDWPCPRSREDASGCTASFWPDGEQRRAAGDHERHYRLERNTFGCRFYDHFARTSPCEGIVRPSLRVHLFDFQGKLVRGAVFRVEAGGVTIPGVAPDGIAVVHNIPVPTTALVRWSRPDRVAALPPGTFEFELEVFVDIDDARHEDALERRLHNLGYPVELGVELAIRQFQLAIGRLPTGKREDVEDELLARHDRCEPPVEPENA